MKYTKITSATALLLVLTGCCVTKSAFKVPQRTMAGFFKDCDIGLIKITQVPEDQLVELHHQATFTIAAEPANAQFQWRFNGNALPGKTSSTLVIESINTNELGQYDCLVTTLLEEVVSPPAVLAAYTFNNDDIPPHLRKNIPNLAKHPAPMSGAAAKVQPAVTVAGGAATSVENKNIAVKAPPPEPVLKPMMLSTNGGMTMALISRTVVGLPANYGGECPAPYVARMRFPDGSGSVARIFGSSYYYAYDLTDNPTKISYHGNGGNWGCDTNGPVYVTLGSSTRFYFYVYFPDYTMVPPTGSDYYLFLYGFGH